jgi:hypothetical protein
LLEAPSGNSLVAVNLAQPEMADLRAVTKAAEHAVSRTDSALYG